MKCMRLRRYFAGAVIDEERKEVMLTKLAT
jgi:hypothetical protein